MVCVGIPLLLYFRSTVYNLHLYSKFKLAALIKRKILVNTDSVKCFDNSQKIFWALATHYSKLSGYFSNLNFHEIFHIILQHK